MKRSNLRFLIGGMPLVALLGACAHTDPVPPRAPLTDYQLGRGDLVEVQVWKEPALSATVPVRPDGRISLPMAGEIQAAGRTTADLRTELTDKLRKYVPEPAVTVMVHEVRAPRIFVLGEVAHPGSYPLAGTLSVLEAMAVAGGTTEFASRGKVVVIRRAGLGGAERPQRFRVSLDAIVDGKTAPLELVAGDTVYVP